jgi:hypothetical protein
LRPAKEGTGSFALLCGDGHISIPVILSVTVILTLNDFKAYATHFI